MFADCYSWRVRAAAHGESAVGMERDRLSPEASGKDAWRPRGRGGERRGVRVGDESEQSESGAKKLKRRRRKQLSSRAEPHPCALKHNAPCCRRNSCSQYNDNTRHKECWLENIRNI